MHLMVPLPVPPSTGREFAAAQGREELRLWLRGLRDDLKTSQCASHWESSVGAVVCCGGASQEVGR